MNKKDLVSVFNKYIPNEKNRNILLSATDYKLRADKEKKMLEVKVAFPKIFKKSELYFLERELEGYKEYKEKVKYKLFPYIW